MTTMAARPAGIQGLSSPCNIHQSRKNSAAAAPAAVAIYAEADGILDRGRRLAEELRERVDFWKLGSIISMQEIVVRR